MGPFKALELGSEMILSEKKNKNVKKIVCLHATIEYSAEPVCLCVCVW